MPPLDLDLSKSCNPKIAIQEPKKLGPSCLTMYVWFVELRPRFRWSSKLKTQSDKLEKQDWLDTNTSSFPPVSISLFRGLADMDNDIYGIPSLEISITFLCRILECPAPFALVTGGRLLVHQVKNSSFWCP